MRFLTLEEVSTSHCWINKTILHHKRIQEVERSLKPTAIVSLSVATSQIELVYMKSLHWRRQQQEQKINKQYKYMEHRLIDIKWDQNGENPKNKETTETETQATKM